jgi:N-acetylneuraminic acid mutarotase
MGVGRSSRAVLVASLFAAACTAMTEPDESTSIEPPDPATSPSTKAKLCQPFPDSLYDGVLDAYRARDLAALEEIVTATGIVDVSSVPHAGTSRFSDVSAWAEAGWAAEDRLDSSGYSAFSPDRYSFQFLINRTNAALRADGIEGLSFTLTAHTNGCTIDSLRSSGPLIAQSNPCAFYEAFGDEPDVGVAPTGCLDGSGRYGRADHIAVWTGNEMLAFGGRTGGYFRGEDVRKDGIGFRPASGKWTALPPLEDGSRFQPTGAVWTGTEVLVFGSNSGRNARVLMFDPSSDRWRPTARPPITPRPGATAVWTDDELLLWGGAGRGDKLPTKGLAYEPAEDDWRVTATSPIGGRYDQAAVWTGREMVVWGGSDHAHDLDNGAAYDPATDTWRVLPVGPLGPRTDHVAAWTGREMIVTGGTAVSRSRRAMGAYSPATNTWRTLPEPPIDGRHWHSAVWTGTELIVWGGYDDRRARADGAAYDPVRDRWRKLARSPLRPRCNHTAVWTGKVMVVFGGYPACGSSGHLAFGDAATYDPDSDEWTRIIPEIQA